MKIENQITDVIKVGESKSKQATISEHKLSKLQYILTKGLYSDPITAVIAEITNNGIDAVVQAGKDPIKNPVTVEINKTPQGNYFFRVTDKGIGLDNQGFENILMNYLESTKEDDENSIGFFGLGSKSFLSLDRQAIFICRKGGYEWTYVAYQGEQFCEYDLVSEKSTTLPDGVVFEIPIMNWGEKMQFVDKARQKLAYYDTVALIIDGQLENNKITRSQDWQYSSKNTDSFIHLCLKDVYYKIEWSKLGMMPIDLPIGLRFGLKDGIAVTPSRESVIYTQKVIDIIKKKIATTAEWFVKKYNEVTPDEYKSIIEAWNLLDKSGKIVRVNDLDFEITPLLSYSRTKAKPLKIKDVSLRDPVWYKSNSKYILAEYTTVSIKNHYGLMHSKKKSLQFTTASSKILDNKKVILVDSIPLGYVRNYLKEKYPKEECTFIVRNSLERRLRVKPQDTAGLPMVVDSESYYHFLYLKAFPKNEWRGRIQEFQRVEKEFKDKIIDERGVENTKPFESWLEDYKQLQKDSRSGHQRSISYKGLNKQSDEMTISIARSARRGDKMVTLDKKVFKIKDLYKQPHLFLIFSRVEDIEEYWNILRGSNIKCCMIGSKEINKLPLFKTKKFIKFEEFMSRDCKPFQRIASSILFQKVIDAFDTVIAEREDLFKHCLSSYMDDYKVLDSYIHSNMAVHIDRKSTDAILEVAEEKDLFDKQYWNVYLKLKEAIKKFDFLTCLKEPNAFDSEEIKKYNRVINQLLLFQKKYYDLEGYELVKKSDIPSEEELEEEEELDIEFA